MYDIIIPHIRSKWGNELRYALRSWDKYFGRFVRNVFIVGYLPPYIDRDKVIHIPKWQPRGVLQASLCEVVEKYYDQISNVFIITDDDTVLLKPLRISDIKAYYRFTDKSFRVKLDTYFAKKPNLRLYQHIIYLNHAYCLDKFNSAYVFNYHTFRPVFNKDFFIKSMREALVDFHFRLGSYLRASRVLDIMSVRYKRFSPFISYSVYVNYHLTNDRSSILISSVNRYVMREYHIRTDQEDDHDIRDIDFKVKVMNYFDGSLKNAIIHLRRIFREKSRWEK